MGSKGDEISRHVNAHLEPEGRGAVLGLHLPPEIMDYTARAQNQVSTRMKRDDISNGIRHVPRIQSKLHKSQGTVVSEQSCHATSCSERSCTTADIIMYRQSTRTRIRLRGARTDSTVATPVVPKCSPSARRREHQ